MSRLCVCVVLLSAASAAIAADDYQPLPLNEVPKAVRDAVMKRFPDAKHAASYAGLVPSTYQSGEHEAHGRITKRGSAELRAMLCEAAHHASRPDHPLNPYFARLCARRGYKMAIVAVAHRLCRIIFAMLRHQSDFDVAKLGVERGPFEHKIVRAYRLKASSQ